MMWTAEPSEAVGRSAKSGGDEMGNEGIKSLGSAPLCTPWEGRRGGGDCSLAWLPEEDMNFFSGGINPPPLPGFSKSVK